MKTRDQSIRRYRVAKLSSASRGQKACGYAALRFDSAPVHNLIDHFSAGDDCASSGAGEGTLARKLGNLANSNVRKGSFASVPSRLQHVRLAGHFGNGGSVLMALAWM